MDPASVAVCVEDPESAEAVALMEAMWAELGALYEANRGPMEWRPADLGGAGCAFVMAWCDGRAAGCAAVVPLDSVTGEVKRLYVVPARRGRGIARTLMSALEGLALGLGYERLRLETGIQQAAAAGLYRSLGFYPVRCWGRYALDPRSLCFERSLLP